LLKAHEEKKDVNINTDAKKILLPQLKAKPIRTASGIAVVAVMCKPHRCPHINKTGNICLLTVLHGCRAPFAPSFFLRKRGCRKSGRHIWIGTSSLMVTANGSKSAGVKPFVSSAIVDGGPQPG
uniref:Uncharacterized protein n=1 Tax=Glossina morsitans morsitans TaxID=37546 RepID=A0A1B0G2U1_GLOMM